MKVKVKMYSYQGMKGIIYTDSGLRKFLKIRDFVHEAIKKTGCIRMENVISYVAGDPWEAMACVDRLVELGEISEIFQPYVPGQNRIFIKS